MGICAASNKSTQQSSLEISPNSKNERRIQASENNNEESNRFNSNINTTDLETRRNENIQKQFLTRIFVQLKNDSAVILIDTQYRDNLETKFMAEVQQAFPSQNCPDDITQINTMYRSLQCKPVNQFKQHGISLMIYNEDMSKSFKKIFVKIIQDYHFQLFYSKEFSQILQKSQESFVKNVQISEKYINNYGALHIIKEYLKQYQIDIILQNQFELQQGSLLYHNKLQITIQDLPAAILLSQKRFVHLKFNQTQITYAMLIQNASIRMSFLCSIHKLISKDNLLFECNLEIMLLSLTLQDKFIVVSICFPNTTIEDTQSIVDMMNIKMNRFIGFEQATISPLFNYIGVELNDLTPILEKDTDDSYNKFNICSKYLHFWKITNNQGKQQLNKQIGYLTLKPQLDLYKLKLTQEQEIENPSIDQENTIQIKIQGLKKNYQLIIQIAYGEFDIQTPFKILQAENQIYLRQLGLSTLKGIIIKTDSISN